MVKQILILASIVFIFAGIANQNDKQNPSTEPFAVANVYFEQNATDGDVEVVFEIKGNDEGLNKLTIISPDNRTVLDLTAPENSTMGIRQFRFESPEPKDVESLKAAYPEGTYKFSGATAKGTEFQSECTLNHNLPETVFILYPGAEAENVNISNLKITWTPVKKIVSYILEIDQAELGINLLVKLPASGTSFTVPKDFLQAGKEYTLSIGTVTKENNRSFVETAFLTTGEE